MYHFPPDRTRWQDPQRAQAPSPHLVRPAPRVVTSSDPDLQSQFEAILDTVWVAEANWRFDDRLDMALRTPRRIR